MQALFIMFNIYISTFVLSLSADSTTATVSFTTDNNNSQPCWFEDTSCCIPRTYYVCVGNVFQLRKSFFIFPSHASTSTMAADGMGRPSTILPATTTT